MTAIPQPFPYASLPQLTPADLALQKRVRAQYSFLEGSRDFFSDFLAPFRSFLPGGFKLDLMQVSALRFSDFQNRFASGGLFCLIKVLPQNRFAFLSFDPHLAKFLVTSALSGGVSSPSQDLTDQVRPLTALEEGVVEYLVVACLQQIETQFQKKDFSLIFETILTESNQLTGFFSTQDELAVFSFLLHGAQRDFGFELALPLTLGKELGWDRSGEEFLQHRIQDFQRFKMDFNLEIGQVELVASEFDELQEGDIILLDEVRLTNHQPLKGRAVLRPMATAGGIAYDIVVHVEHENLIAEIIGVL